VATLAVTHSDLFSLRNVRAASGYRTFRCLMKTIELKAQRLQASLEVFLVQMRGCRADGDSWR
jgi:hypothetical protein